MQRRTRKILEESALPEIHFRKPETDKLAQPVPLSDTRCEVSILLSHAYGVAVNIGSSRLPCRYLHMEDMRRRVAVQTRRKVGRSVSPLGSAGASAFGHEPTPRSEGDAVKRLVKEYRLFICKSTEWCLSVSGRTAHLS